MEHSSPELYEMHAVVKGNVQGVGFRATTRDLAMMLGIKGSVRNLGDGSVEIYAQGSKEHLEELIRKLKEDTEPAKIESACIQYFPIENPHADFRIVH